MALYVLYVDESGVSVRHPSQTSHYALAGVAVDASTWVQKRDQIEAIRQRFGFPGTEIHVAWLLRPYVEQAAIPDFAKLSARARRGRVARMRAAKVRLLRDNGQTKAARELERFHKKSAAYTHLLLAERIEVARAVSDLVGSWSDTVLFGEVADKSIATPFRPDKSAFEQVLTRIRSLPRATEFLRRRRLRPERCRRGPLHGLDGAVPGNWRDLAAAEADCRTSLLCSKPHERHASGR